MAKADPYISVIIPALNEEKYIKYPLSGLGKQTFRDFETIVVDGGSTDKTIDLIKGSGARVAVCKRKGIGAGRNMGATLSSGSILVFLDADTIPSRPLLASYAKVFEDPGIVAATGPIYPLEKTNARIKWGYKFVSVMFVKFTIQIGMPSVVGSNFAVRADAFRKVRGFDPKLVTYEDWDLSMKLKKLGRIVFVDDAMVRTSARRVMAWGVWGYFLFHFINMIMYNLFKTSRKHYKTIR